MKKLKYILAALGILMGLFVLFNPIWIHSLAIFNPFWILFILAWQVARFTNNQIVFGLSLMIFNGLVYYFVGYLIEKLVEGIRARTMATEQVAAQGAKKPSIIFHVSMLILIVILVLISLYILYLT